MRRNKFLKEYDVMTHPQTNFFFVHNQSHIQTNPAAQPPREAPPRSGRDILVIALRPYLSVFRSSEVMMCPPRFYRPSRKSWGKSDLEKPFITPHVTLSLYSTRAPRTHTRRKLKQKQQGKESNITTPQKHNTTSSSSVYLPPSLGHNVLHMFCSSFLLVKI